MKIIVHAGHLGVMRIGSRMTDLRNYAQIHLNQSIFQLEQHVEFACCNAFLRKKVTGWKKLKNIELNFFQNIQQKGISSLHILNAHMPYVAKYTCNVTACCARKQHYNRTEACRLLQEKSSQECFCLLCTRKCCHMCETKFTRDSI